MSCGGLAVRSISIPTSEDSESWTLTFAVEHLVNSDRHLPEDYQCYRMDWCIFSACMDHLPTNEKMRRQCFHSMDRGGLWHLQISRSADVPLGWNLVWAPIQYSIGRLVSYYRWNQTEDLLQYPNVGREWSDRVEATSSWRSLWFDCWWYSVSCSIDWPCVWTFWWFYFELGSDWISAVCSSCWIPRRYLPIQNSFLLLQCIRHHRWTICLETSKTRDVRRRFALSLCRQPTEVCCTMMLFSCQSNFRTCCGILGRLSWNGAWESDDRDVADQTLLCLVRRAHGVVVVNSRPRMLFDFLVGVQVQMKIETLRALNHLRKRKQQINVFLGILFQTLRRSVASAARRRLTPSPAWYWITCTACEINNSSPTV